MHRFQRGLRGEVARAALVPDPFTLCHLCNTYTMIDTAS